MQSVLDDIIKAFPEELQKKIRDNLPTHLNGVDLPSLFNKVVEFDRLSDEIEKLHLEFHRSIDDDDVSSDECKVRAAEHYKRLFEIHKQRSVFTKEIAKVIKLLLPEELFDYLVYLVEKERLYHKLVGINYSKLRLGMEPPHKYD